jgi:aminopeptidase N
MKEAVARNVVRREDYTPYPWAIDQLCLRFDIGRRITTVNAEIQFSRLDQPGGNNDIVLDGEGLELVSVSLDSKPLAAGEFTVDTDRLLIHHAPAKCLVSTEARIRPHENTALEGFYPSGEFLLTQCEAEGFRRITYFPDRPDVMTRYEVTIVAERTLYPVLLSNGNAVGNGDLGDGRHWVRWVDPYRKPSYLFALVAGNLEFIEDHFTTRSGRNVVLRVYVEKQNLDKCGHAMKSLIKAMQWDEQRFGLEYDLDIYNIVATDDFNMGAMENKSLNIFNSKYVLAKPETATDDDYQAIEGVIGHEYFHNWTGNRVTCRDWFQLTLKEGLTVFRDQEFTSDMQSRAVKHIRDVRDLRSRQFPEDAGPMSHPIRPDEFVTINNFYTMTVYQKGATIIRMVHTLLGEAGFQKGMKLYFHRHDGRAVTCDDFLAAMADANDVDLKRFGRWYGQSGTPEVTVRSEYDARTARYTLHLSQRTPPTHDQASKQALVIPFACGLLTPQGQQIPLQSPGEPGPEASTRLLMLEHEQQSFVFENVSCEPIPSLLRNFSAPVKVYDYSVSDLAVLMQHDPDAFIRWEAAQLLAQAEIMRNRECLAQGVEMHLLPQLTEAFAALLGDRDSDPALLAEALMLPGEDYLAETMKVIDVDGIHQARKFVKRALAMALQEPFDSVYQGLNQSGGYDHDAMSVARRSLKNLCLSYLVETPPGVSLAERQLALSNTMTDTLAALAALVYSGAAAAQQAMASFESNWKQDPLVMDKWFVLHATRPGADTVDLVAALMDNPAFSLTNPNKVRSLIGAFAMGNPTGFHALAGSGYRFVADRVIELDRLNPQAAARIATAFNRWRRYDSLRQKLMQTELKRIAATENISPDVAEIMSNALAACLT